MTAVALTYAELNALYIMVTDEKARHKARKNADNEMPVFWTNLHEKMLLALTNARTGDYSEQMIQLGTTSDPDGLPEQPLGTYPVEPATGYLGGTDPTWNAGNHLATESDIPNTIEDRPSPTPDKQRKGH